jgi:hypothetical protein
MKALLRKWQVVVLALGCFGGNPPCRWLQWQHLPIHTLIVRHGVELWKMEAWSLWQQHHLLSQKQQAAKMAPSP